MSTQKFMPNINILSTISVIYHTRGCLQTAGKQNPSNTMGAGGKFLILKLS